MDPPFKVTWCWGSTEPGGTWHVGGAYPPGSFSCLPALSWSSNPSRGTAPRLLWPVADWP